MPDVRDRQQGIPTVEWEKCLMCVSGRLKCGLIRWTGYVCQYKNIYKLRDMRYSCEHMIRVHLVRNHAGVLSGNTVKGEGYW